MLKSIISRTRLFNHEQTTIYLIEQQLKSCRFFDDLERIGLGRFEFEPNLDHVILKNVGLDDGTDKTFAQYFKILCKHSNQLQPDIKVIQMRARKMYNELISLKKLKAVKRK